MFDCLEPITPSLQAALNAHARPATLTDSTFKRRNSGTNWVIFRPHPDQNGALIPLRRIAGYLGCDLILLSDGALAVTGLDLDDILGLSQQWGHIVDIEAHIAIGSQGA